MNFCHQGGACLDFWGFFRTLTLFLHNGGRGEIKPSQFFIFEKKLKYQTSTFFSSILVQLIEAVPVS